MTLVRWVFLVFGAQTSAVRTRGAGVAVALFASYGHGGTLTFACGAHDLWGQVGALEILRADLAALAVLAHDVGASTVRHRLAAFSQSFGASSATSVLPVPIFPMFLARHTFHVLVQAVSGGAAAAYMLPTVGTLVALFHRFRLVARITAGLCRTIRGCRQVQRGDGYERQIIYVLTCTSNGGQEGDLTFLWQLPTLQGVLWGMQLQPRRLGVLWGG